MSISFKIKNKPTAVYYGFNNTRALFQEVGAIITQASGGRILVSICAESERVNGLHTPEMPGDTMKEFNALIKKIEAVDCLLKALRELLNSMDENGSCQYEMLRAAGRDAIAKAEGGDL